MPAPTYVLEWEERASYTKRFGWRDAAGTLIDNSTYTAAMMVKDVVDGTLIIELTDANSRIVLGIQGSAPDDYNVEIVLTEADLTGLDWPAGPTNAVYDLFLTSADETYNKKFIKGWIEWTPAVTE